MLPAVLGLANAEMSATRSLSILGPRASRLAEVSLTEAEICLAHCVGCAPCIQPVQKPIEHGMLTVFAVATEPTGMMSLRTPGVPDFKAVAPYSRAAINMSIATAGIFACNNKQSYSCRNHPIP